MAKILIIEDAEGVREMMTMALTNFGHEVEGVSSTIDLTAQILSFNPQLVIIDVYPGNESGRAICKQIKAADDGLAVILMSTSAQLLVDYESCLANDIIEKPFEIMELKNKIEKALTHKAEGRIKMRYPILPAFLPGGMAAEIPGISGVVDSVHTSTEHCLGWHRFLRPG